MEILVCPKCKGVIYTRKGVLALLIHHLYEQHELSDIKSEIVEEAEGLATNVLSSLDKFHFEKNSGNNKDLFKNLRDVRGSSR